MGAGKKSSILSTLILWWLPGAPWQSGNWRHHIQLGMTQRRAQGGRQEKLPDRSWRPAEVSSAVVVQNWQGRPLLKSSASVEGPVYRVPVLQDWLPWLIAWRRQTSCCGCFVYLYKLLLSMPFLQCQLNCCRRISLKPGKGSNWASFVKVPRNFAISALPSPLQFPVLVTLEILMWILYYFSAIRKKYFGKVHLVKKSWFALVSVWSKSIF